MAVKEPGAKAAGGPRVDSGGPARPAARIEVHEPRPAHHLLATTRSAWLWLLVRLYVGGDWIAAGARKLHDPVYLAGGRLAEPARFGAGGHTTLPGWYASFLQTQVLPHPVLWAHIVAWAQVALGAGVVLGAFTGIFVFLGSLLNTNFLLAGGAGLDPLLVALGVALILAWRVAGWWGVDRWLLPTLGCSLREEPGR